jgi:hypothetical protein
MNATQDKVGHSAEVHMQLNLNGFVLPIGQLGPDFLILRDPTDHPPAEAEIVMSIDGEERRWNVHLPDGISVDKVRTKIA